MAMEQVIQAGPTRYQWRYSLTKANVTTNSRVMAKNRTNRTKRKRRGRVKCLSAVRHPGVRHMIGILYGVLHISHESFTRDSMDCLRHSKCMYPTVPLHWHTLTRLVSVLRQMRQKSRDCESDGIGVGVISAQNTCQLGSHSKYNVLYSWQTNTN